ncbi:MAG: helix-turn-helix domain-containing protein [Erysipelotrichaceae bacterium]|nr:helix-turn-helix domain-containing protein [Erysipelotrichaceae bacterium]
MNRYSIRQYMELGYICLNEAVTVNSFVRKFNLSNYEFTNDFDVLIRMGKEFGVQITRQKDVLSFNVTDDDLYKKQSRNLRSFWYTNQVDIDSKDRVIQNEICKAILWNDDGYINLDDLAERLGYSRSSLRTHLKNTRRFFDSYGIFLKSVPHYGLEVVGSEMNIRKCFRVIVTLYDVRITTDEDNEDIINSLNNYSQLYEIVKNSLIRYDVVMSRLERRKLNTMLIVQNARIKSGRSIDRIDGIDSVLLEKLKKEKWLVSMVDGLCEELHRSMGMGSYNKLEKESLLPMIAAMGYGDSRIKKIISELYQNEMEELFNLINQYLMKSFGFTVNDEFYLKFLKEEIGHIAVEKHISILTGFGRNINGRNPMIYKRPLMFKILKDTRDIIRRYYSLPIPLSRSSALVSLLASYVLTFEISAHEPLVGITSRNSLFEPEIIRKGILRKRQDINPDNIRVFNYDVIDVADVDYINEYDLVFCDQKLTHNRKHISYRDNGLTVENIINTIRNTMNYCRDIIDDSHIFSNKTDYEGTEKLQKDICDMSGADENEVRKEFDNPLYINGVMALIVLNRNHKPYMQLGHISKIEDAEFSDISSYVVVAADINETNIRFYDSLLCRLVNNELFFNDLYENSDIQTINLWLNKILNSTVL